MNDCNNSNNDHSRMDHQYIISWLLVVRLANHLHPGLVLTTSGPFIFPHHQYALVLCALSCGLEGTTFKLNTAYERNLVKTLSKCYCFNKRVPPIHESAACDWVWAPGHNSSPVFRVGTSRGVTAWHMVRDKLMLGPIMSREMSQSQPGIYNRLCTCVELYSILIG